MHKDIVETSEFPVDLHDVETAKRDVPQAQPADEIVAVTNGLRAQVDADELAFRPLERHRDEIGALAASKFKHAAGFEACRVHPEQRAERRQAGPGWVSPNGWLG